MPVLCAQPDYSINAIEWFVGAPTSKPPASVANPARRNPRTYAAITTGKTEGSPQHLEHSKWKVSKDA
jgi:hypothetical protein